MDRAAGSGLEVKPSTGPEYAPQPEEYKYYLGGGAPTHAVFGQPHQHQFQAKKPGPSKAFLWLATTAIICLALALDAGLGAGLAIRHKSSSPSSAATTGTQANDAPVSIVQASNASVTIVQASNAPVTISKANDVPVTISKANDAPGTATQSAQVATITPSPTTLPSPVICPAANGSTYVATNKPFPTIDPQLPVEVTNSSFSFEILCDTDFEDDTYQGGSTIDVQLLTNVSTLNDCLDECALYSFRTSRNHFPAYGCTGVSWGKGLAQQQAGYQWPVCWLKSNVTLGSANRSAELAGYDGAVMLGV